MLTKKKFRVIQIKIVLETGYHITSFKRIKTDSRIPIKQGIRKKCRQQLFQYFHDKKSLEWGGGISQVKIGISSLFGTLHQTISCNLDKKLCFLGVAKTLESQVFKNLFGTLTVAYLHHKYNLNWTKII